MRGLEVELQLTGRLPSGWRSLLVLDFSLRIEKESRVIPTTCQLDLTWKPSDSFECLGPLSADPSHGTTIKFEFGRLPFGSGPALACPESSEGEAAPLYFSRAPLTVPKGRKE